MPLDVGEGEDVFLPLHVAPDQGPFSEELGVLAKEPDLVGSRYERFRKLGVPGGIKEQK